MRRFLVFFEPIKILDLSPEVLLPFPLKLFFIFLPIFVHKGVGAKYNFITIFNDCLAGDKDFKSSMESIMYSQLMAT